MGLIEIRCSSLPRLAACAAAIDPPAIRIEGERGPSDLGTALHAAMAGVVIRGEWPDVEALAHEHNVPEEELAGLVGMARSAWNAKLAAMFPDAEVEVEMSADDSEAGIRLTGHADLVSVIGPQVRILDYKSGWLDQDADQQLRGYAMLAMLKYGCTEAVVSKWQIRHGTLTTKTYTHDDLVKWWAWLASHIREAEIHRTGQHCGFCPRAMECEARRSALRLAASTFGEAITLPADPDSLADLLTKARAVARVAEAAIEAIRAEVKLHGDTYGPLRIITQERREIDVARSYELLSETIGTERLHEAMRVSKTAVEDAVKADAPRGQKGKLVALLMAELEALGALKVNTIEKLEVSNGARINAAKTAAITGGGATAE
jgi:hypothetical protein